MIRDKYWQAPWGAEKANVAVEGLGDVSINIAAVGPQYHGDRRRAGRRRRDGGRHRGRVGRAGRPPSSGCR